MRRRPRRISKASVFALLLLAAFVAIWIPARWTQPLTRLMQLFAPAQQVVRTAAGGADSALDEWANRPVAGREYQELARRANALENRLMSLTQQVRQLEQANRELAALRDSTFGQRGRLIPARVVRADAASFRDGLVLDRGQTSGVAPGQAVVSARLDPGQAEDGGALLGSEFLIGEVIQTAPYTATVRLLSDPESRMPVSIGRLGAGQWTISSEEFFLSGAAHGRMFILDVPHRYSESRQIRVGDAVVCVEGQFGLPASLMIGRIVAIRPDAKQPHLLDRIEVRPPFSSTSLTRAYIVDLTHAR